MTSVDGPLTVDEPALIAPAAAGAFSPLREALGFDARELTPLLVQRITFAAAETRSFERAAIVMKQVGDQPVSAKTIERVVHDVGWELAERRDADPKTDDALAQRPESPPDLAVVECDGGRIRTREPGHGPGVHRTTEGWRETKNACLDPRPADRLRRGSSARTTGVFLRSQARGQDRRDRGLVGRSPLPGSAPRLAGSDGPEPADAAPADDWRPKRLVRTVLSSMAESKDFGKQMAREAKRRRFFEATPRRSWAMVCPGTGRSGSSTSLTSRRSSISFMC